MAVKIRVKFIINKDDETMQKHYTVATEMFYCFQKTLTRETVGN